LLIPPFYNFGQFYFQFKYHKLESDILADILALSCSSPQPSTKKGVKLPTLNPNPYPYLAPINDWLF